MTSPGRTQAWLVDERWAKAYPLGDSTMIGRDPESTIILRDPVVSRSHAAIVRRDNRFYLRAFGSAGTKLNGARVGDEMLLSEGDRIEIAYTSLRFTLKAPTGEMFIVRRDQPTPYDNPDIPTRPSFRASQALARIVKRHWHFVAGIALLALMLLVLLAGL